MGILGLDKRVGNGRVELVVFFKGQGGDEFVVKQMKFVKLHKYTEKMWVKNYGRQGYGGWDWIRVGCVKQKVCLFLYDGRGKGIG